MKIVLIGHYSCVSAGEGASSAVAVDGDVIPTSVLLDVSPALELTEFESISKYKNIIFPFHLN